MSSSSFRRRVASVALALAFAAGLPSAGAAGYPESPRRPVQDTWHGTVVTDDYRWLETTDSAEVRAWIAAQNRLTRTTLDALPQRRAIAAEMKQMLGRGQARRSDFAYAGGRLFALKYQPPKNQPSLVVMNAQAQLASERVVLDLTRFDPSGKTAIDWYKPSLDGRLVAVSLSKNGSEDGTLRIFRTDTGRPLPDVVPRVQYPTGGGSVAWAPDGRSLTYTRYPQGNERPPADANFYQQVWQHRLGTPASADTYVIGREFPRIAEIALVASDDGRDLVADVSNGDGGEHGLFLRRGDGPWRRIADYTDGFRQPHFGTDGRLYALGLKGSPRGRIVAMALDDAAADLPGARTVVAESDIVIEAFEVTRNRIVVEALIGGPSELRLFALDGRPLGSVPNEPVASVGIGARLDGDRLLFGSESYVTAQAWWLLDAGRDGAQPMKTALSKPPTYAPGGRLADAEVRREFALSRDGAKVPVTIVQRRGTPRDGAQPVLLTGYGGYGVSIRPYFSRRMAFWLRHGGVLAVANLRGGGEFGEDWHQAGMLTRKQNVFDDFIAVADHLVAQKVTRPERLAIEGGSNGGLLMGAVLTQRPDIARAVVSAVGIHDMMRVEFTPNGAFNVTEFGSVKDEAQFRALLAYSPLHRVKDGTAYPAVLLTTGEHDGRVEPWMSYKMAARLQAANPGGRPVLLRVASDAGHGVGTSLSSAIEQQTDEFTFLFEQLGMK